VVEPWVGRFYEPRAGDRGPKQRRFCAGWDDLQPATQKESVPALRLRLRAGLSCFVPAGLWCSDSYSLILSLAEIPRATNVSAAPPPSAFLGAGSCPPPLRTGCGDCHTLCDPPRPVNAQTSPRSLPSCHPERSEAGRRGDPAERSRRTPIREGTSNSRRAEQRRLFHYRGPSTPRSSRRAGRPRRSVENHACAAAGVRGVISTL